MRKDRLSSKDALSITIEYKSRKRPVSGRFLIPGEPSEKGCFLCQIQLFLVRAFLCIVDDKPLFFIFICGIFNTTKGTKQFTF